MNTILIVDDHDLFREGLTGVINRWNDFTVIGEASDGKEALERTRALLPDIVIMDISMPVLNGLEATKIINREFPSTRIVILTVSEEEENLFQAIKNGASGYINKNVTSDKFYGLLQDLARGEAALTSDMAKKIITEFKISSGRKGVALEIEPLSEREEQVLSLVVQGLTNVEIANKLFLSPNTIKKHIRNILQKLQLNNRIEAAVYAVREGLVG